MGRRGPRPTPSAIVKAQGGHIDKKEPVPAPAHLTPPDDISDDARIIWVETAAAIGHTGVITAVDLEGLRAYAESAAAWRKATALVARGGPLIKGRNGDLVRNPAAIVMKQQGEQMRAWARELGLTPASRVGLQQNLESGQHAGANAKLEAILGAAFIATREIPQPRKVRKVRATKPKPGG
jgi:P27 family predicted phage terminase small subunit